MIDIITGIYKEGIKTGWMEGIVIMFIPFILALINSYIKYRMSEKFLKISKEIKLRNVIVIRDGKEKEISIEDLLVGDILKLNEGDKVNVNGFIFGKWKIGMDESSVTDNSDIMSKINGFELKNNKYLCPFIFSGSHVLKGEGYMIVASVGNKPNSFGEEDEENEDEYNENDNISTLKKQLNQLFQTFGDLVCLSSILIGAILLIKEIITSFYKILEIIFDI